jgi:CubicO group peptidase (beta-lactamase class C family)
VQILKKETVLEMCKNQIGNISIADPGAFFNPAVCCNLEGIVSTTSKWGLAWMIDTDPEPYGRNAGTVLWGGAANTMFYLDFKAGVAVSAYTQVLPFNDPAFMGLFTRFSEIIYRGY